MSTKPLIPDTNSVEAVYDEPHLLVHGSVADLTLGQGGAVPDTAPSGSQFPDGSAG